MNLIFTGTIKEGKLKLSKLPQFQDYLHNLEGKPVEVTVQKVTHKRSNQQNRYYWGVVVKTIADHTGHDPEQVHELLKQRFSPRWHFDDRSTPLGLVIPTSTTRLDTIAFVEYTEKARLWANEYLDLQIPLPGEIDI